MIWQVLGLLLVHPRVEQVDAQFVRGDEEVRDALIVACLWGQLPVAEVALGKDPCPHAVDS